MAKRAGDLQQLTFRVGGRRMALPAARVREVARLPRMTRVPHAPPSLMGLANLRGAVVPVVSLAELLGEERVLPTRVVVIDGEDPVGLAVDAVEAVGEASGRSVRSLEIEQLLGTAFGSTEARRSGYARVRSASSGETGAMQVPLVAFGVGGQAFALPLADVDEVVRVPQEIAALPDADAVVVGTATLRGELLPLLSLGALLGLGSEGASRRRRVVVVRIGRHRVGLMVGAMHGILRVAPEQIDPVPSVFARGSAEARIQAICRLDGGQRLVSVLATDHLLREELTARLLQGQGGEQAAEEAMVSEASEQFLLFRIGEEDFGLPLAAVEEVARLPDKLTRLPKAPAFVEGVINLRGNVVPVIDQARRFAGTATSGARRRVVVVAIGEMRVGFLVDGVSDVLSVPATALRPAPELGGEGTRVFDRVANLEDTSRVVLIVSPQELLDRAERDLVAALARGTSEAS
ncbi:chemotaxis protein CheW [Sphingomonas sp.]|uniref:chemotaxis protein CheW n=1 Tax=Sphingomonas sp. TaxID=28214 RepID=UPI001B11BA17|nr:chemotaxis protein CheW [Sphingomonas sp.]MBO9711444.1 chemotaxis protein CheW [Sphingomonas sp.]